MKTYYTLEYNRTTKTWCVFRNAESDSGFSFVSIYESNNKKLCEKKYKEIKNGNN